MSWLHPVVWELNLAVRAIWKLFKDIYITSKDELILYPKESEEHRTPYGVSKKYEYKCECQKEKMGDGKCDNNSKCNKFECFWDGHDCDDILRGVHWNLTKYIGRRRLPRGLICIRFEYLTLSNQKSYSDFLFEKPVTCFVLMIWQISIVRRFQDLRK